MKFKLKHYLAIGIVALSINSAFAQDNVLEYIKDYPKLEQFRLMYAWLENNELGTLLFSGLSNAETKTKNVQASLDYGSSWFSISDAPATINVPKYDMKHNIPGVFVNPENPILLIRPGQKMPKGEFHVVELETDQGLIITRMVVANNMAKVEELRKSIVIEGGKGEINYEAKEFSKKTIKWGNSLIDASIPFIKAIYPQKSGELDPITLAAVVKRARHGVPAQAVKYSVIATDDKGQPFTGKDTYELTIPPNIVHKKGYMSITLYGVDNRLLIPNEKIVYDRTSYSSRQNDDGTYTITLSPSGKGLNGIPTGKAFYAILRAYVPIKDADMTVIVNKK